jgi:hypothetical protein
VNRPLVPSGICRISNILPAFRSRRIEDATIHGLLPMADARLMRR